MSIGRAWRVGGFVTALAASVGLVAAATSATGAYFSEAKAGTISGSIGGVHLDTSNLTLNYAGLLPGQFQTKTVGYKATGSAPEDIWLVFPAGQANVLNGQAGEPSGDAALGRFGHFALTSPSGSFTSYNLAAEGLPGTSHTGPTCGVDANGHGGSSQQAANRADHTVPFCPVPNAILLSSNLAPGQSASATITFGVTQIMNNPAQEDLPMPYSANFSIVATQHNIRPDNVNN